MCFLTIIILCEGIGILYFIQSVILVKNDNFELNSESQIIIIIIQIITTWYQLSIIFQ